MTELTDYEINRRLAEIAGIELCPACAAMGVLHATSGHWNGDWYPLHDWSQLGPLMERERIIAWPSEGDEDDTGVTGWRACAEECEEPEPFSTDMKRAICLAIIAAHEDDQ